jgi:multiple sugar transport system substrate-binding protein
MTIAAEQRSRTFRIAVRKFPPFETAIRAQWEAFGQHAHTGLALDLVSLGLHPLEHALFTSGRMASGDWDIAFVATDWIAPMHALGCAVDLQPFLDRDPPPDFPQGWHPSLLRLQRVQNTVLGVPYHDGPECLIYRRDLFSDPTHQHTFRQTFGRELAPPTTWQQFHETARFFNRPLKNLYGSVFAAFPDGHNSVYDFLLQLWTRGGELFTPSGDLRFATPEAEDALTFYREILSDSSAVHPQCSQLDSVSAGLRFSAGEAAMMVNWFGFATHAHTAPDSAVRGLVDVASIPAGPRGRSVSLNVYWILSVAAGSPHRDLAWRFLHHTQTQAMDKLTSTSGAIGCRRSTWNDPAIRSEIPFYPQMESLHNNAREIAQREDWPHIAAIIDTLITQTITTQRPIRRLLEDADASALQRPFR